MTQESILAILIVLLFVFGLQLVEATIHCKKKYLFGFNRRIRDRRNIDRLTGGRRSTDVMLILPKLDTSKYYIPKKKIYKLNCDGTLRLR
jgi:hypothetical protein